MMSFEYIVSVVYFLAMLILLCAVVKRDLQMLQQNSYRNERLWRWIKTSSEYMSTLRILNFALFLIGISTLSESVYVVLIIVIAVILECVSLLTKKSKKPLVFTKRVWRLFLPSVVIVTVAAILPAFLTDGEIPSCKSAALILAAVVPFSYIPVMTVNYLLKPIEKAINNKYCNDAKRILASMPGMLIIGVTGSYGKTSTKHYLSRILSEKYSVLMTPGSFNTPMGVVRTVREMLKPYNNVFIVEMGAKNIGDIKEICDIVHPTYGIITAVGEQHLESFKTIENVQRTKFELIDALPKNGFAVLNNDFEFVANRVVDNVEASRYSTHVDAVGCDYVATDIKYTSHGTTFTIKGHGKELELSTKLVGEFNISNLLAAVIMAMKLGVSDNKIQYAVSKIEQVEHRLNVKRTPGGITIIDDAFNSNPDGSRMALDVLAGMTGGRRIVITPGMIELGSKQEYYNELFGEHIAESCDVAIIVGSYNKESILKGISRKKTPETNVITVPTFAEAQAKMLELARSGDTVLYENDLPDTFK